MYNRELPGTSSAENSVPNIADVTEIISDAYGTEENTQPSWHNIADQLNQEAAEFENATADLEQTTANITEATDELASQTAALAETALNSIEPDTPPAETETTASETDSPDTDDTKEVTDTQTVANLAEEQQAEITAGTAIEEALVNFESQKPTEEGGESESQGEQEEQPQDEEPETEQNPADEEEKAPDMQNAPQDSPAEESEQIESAESNPNAEILQSTIDSLAESLIHSEDKESNQYREQQHTYGVLTDAYKLALAMGQDQPIETIFSKVADGLIKLGDDEETKSEEYRQSDRTSSDAHDQQAQAYYWRAAIASKFASGNFKNYVANHANHPATNETTDIPETSNIQPISDTQLEQPEPEEIVETTIIDTAEQPTEAIGA